MRCAHRGLWHSVVRSLASSGTRSTAPADRHPSPDDRATDVLGLAAEGHPTGPRRSLRPDRTEPGGRRPADLPLVDRRRHVALEPDRRRARALHRNRWSGRRRCHWRWSRPAPRPHHFFDTVNTSSLTMWRRLCTVRDSWQIARSTTDQDCEARARQLTTGGSCTHRRAYLRPQRCAHLGRRASAAMTKRSTVSGRRRRRP